MNMRSLYHF